MNLQLPAQLAERLRNPLPGWSAHARMQPELSFGRHRGPARFDARPAAVMILLYPRADRWHLPLTLRTPHMPDHANQVSFPGGAIDPGESSGAAAQRELFEELGVPATDVELLGHLSDLYLYASNYHVVPWIGVTQATPNWRPNPAEVERLLEVPLAHFLDPTHVGTFERTQREVTFTAPCYVWESDQIWGATSMILAELVTIAAGLDL